MIKNKEIIINLKNLEYNLTAIKNHIQKRELVATLKADAYGHGLIQTFKFLKEKGINYFGIFWIDEALKIKKIDKRANVLLYINTDKSAIKNLVKFDITPFVADSQYLSLIEQECRKQNKKIKVHLKVDVGMNRYGIKIENALNLAMQIQNSKLVEFEGVCTHLPTTENRKITQAQIEKFVHFINELKTKNIKPKFIHASNSEHITNYPISEKFNMVRPGLILYGYHPNSNSLNNNLQLKPVLSLYSKIIFLKKIKKDEQISYSGLFTAKEDMQIGLLPVGYFDGIPQNTSNNFYCIIRDKKCFIRGKICMNISIIEIPKDLKINIGEKVEITSERLSLDILSKESGMSKYEILCSIGKHEKKKYLY
ncbi:MULTISPECIES: alanine racemase [Borrelia]|uniref:Alanine racemase n=3 Tax=Borrelia turicatae TaxID=142 RepID=A0A172XAS5_BORTU|nr:MULTISPECIES: alanine racemase [Borrelia]AAX17497.1 alanine racemase [Borrelia turicatae 91E135]ANF33658.1 alanine racemase [Borrelia turicatae]UPA11855.1 alanine racemase [Borrelia venezuelensis]UPA13028.1 alanine racemase [Borrelia turicatae 91E135]UPA14515.1 alanine racemase [Borrelia turicatae]